MDLIEKYYKRNFIILAFCIAFAAVSYQIIIPFLPKYLEEMDLTYGQISFWTGLIFSSQAMAMMIANPIWGKVGDTYGRKLMIIRAGTVITLMFIALYFCTKPYQILLVRFINGFFTGYIPASIALISTNSPKEKMLPLVAAAQSCMAVGQIIGPSLGGILSSTVGFRNTSLISAGLVFTITFIALLFVKEVNKPKNVEKTPFFQDLKEMIIGSNQKLLFYFCFMQGFCITSIMPFVVIHLSHSNVKDWIVGCIYAFPAVGMIIFAQKCSKLGRTFGFDKVLKIAIFAIGIIMILISINNNVYWFSIMFFLYGLALAVVITNVTAKTVSGVDESHRGRVLSVQDSFKTLGNVVAPISVGIIAKVYSTNMAFLVVGIALIVTGILFFYLLKWK